MTTDKCNPKNAPATGQTPPTGQSSLGDQTNSQNSSQNSLGATSSVETESGWDSQAGWDQPGLNQAVDTSPSSSGHSASTQGSPAQNLTGQNAGQNAGDRRGPAPSFTIPVKEKRPKVSRQDRVAKLFPEPPEQEDFPSRTRVPTSVVLLCVFVTLVALTLYSLNWYSDQVDPPGSPKEAVTLNAPQDASTSDIAKIMESKGIIASGRLFTIWLQFKGRGGFDAGDYKFRKNSSFETALVVLIKGPSIPDEQRITFPEGFRVTQMAGRVAAKIPGDSVETFVEIATTQGKIRSVFQPPTTNNLEGFLFPDTYTFGRESETAIIARLVDTFDGVATQLGLANSKQLVGIEPYQALIVASLIEREAKIDPDRTKISRVIYNRLASRIQLQIDAGIIYAMNNGTNRLYTKDYKYDSPYNTYLHYGLPPTPISNPGRASIEAALHPEQGKWLYYVVTEKNGGHSFAVSMKGHADNIKRAKENGVR